MSAESDRHTQFPWDPSVDFSHAPEATDLVSLSAPGGMRIWYRYDWSSEIIYYPDGHTSQRYPPAIVRKSFTRFVDNTPEELRVGEGL